MNKKKKIGMILIQLVLVAGFTGGLWYFINNQMQPQTVYRLTQDVPENSQISAEDLTAVNIPKDAITSSMVKDPKTIIGKVASSKLYAQQYAVKNMFIEKEDVDPFKTAKKETLRLVSIPAEYTDTLGGAIHSGDKVDLVYIGKSDGAGDGKKAFTYSKTIIQGALVHNVTTDSGFRYESHADRLESNGTTAEDAAGTNEGTMSTVTLAVTPEQAEEIVARKSSGTLQLVGRFSESKDKDSTGFIIGEYEKVYSGQGLAEANK